MLGQNRKSISCDQKWCDLSIAQLLWPSFLYSLSSHPGLDSEESL